MTTKLSPEDYKIFEAFIDKHGIGEVLATIEDICHFKAEHIAENWQDVALAKRWSTVASAIRIDLPFCKDL